MKKIIIVEDDPRMLGSLALLFEKEYEVEKYSDGEEALGRLRENSFDLVIADLFLNGVTGLDLYNAARDKGGFLLIRGIRSGILR